MSNSKGIQRLTFIITIVKWTVANPSKVLLRCREFPMTNKIFLYVIGLIHKNACLLTVYLLSRL